MLGHRPGHRFSDKSGNLYTGLCWSDHAERVFVNEPDLVRIFNNDTEAVETANKPSDEVARLKQCLNLDPSFSDLIQKLVLNIKMRFRHFRTPVSLIPFSRASSPRSPVDSRGKISDL